VPNAYLGVDIGTSGTKSLAINEKGRIIASASAAYPIYHPKAGWSEQDPRDWWNATVTTVRKLVKEAKLKPTDVCGIGLSGQMHGSVFLDAKNRVLRRALLWNDQRTFAECAEIEERAGGRAKLIEWVSNPALTGFTAPKILWLRKHEPHKYDQVRKILLPKDYIRFRLTGEYATEVSDASGTLLLDVTSRQWSRPLLSALEIDGAFLPACFESEEVSGRVTDQAARELGIAPGVPVVGGGGDQAAGAVGNGIVTTGAISATIGTSGVVFAYSDEVKTDPLGRLHTFCHAVRGKWHVMGVVLSAGGSLQWFRNQLADAEVALAKKRRVDPYELLTAMAAKAPAASEGLFFLPYLTGERTPHANPHARGAWVGLSPRHGRAHLVRSLIEGVTYAMRDSLELIKGLGVPISQIRVSGGGARSKFWRQIQADVYGQPVVTINAVEGPAYGVALLAAVGAGCFQSVTEACAHAIKVVGRTSTNPKTKSIYDRAYPQFGNLYRSLKHDFAMIAELTR
jgi:xylulokinase